MQGTGTLREIEELFLFDSADFLSGSNSGGVRNGGAAVNGYASNSGSSGSSPASTVESGIHFVDSDAEQRQRLSSGESDAEVLDEIMRHSSSHNAADTGGALTATTAYPIIHEQQSEPGQLTTLTYRELRSSPPDLSTGSVGHLSCSGESGYFDQANSDFSDLQVFLEGESGIPHLQHLPQPEQPHQILPVVPHPQQTAIKADPGSLEWSYLEPAQPLLSSSVSGVPMRPPMNNQIVIPGSFAADSDDDIWIMSGSHVQWPEPLVVKSEPMASPQEHLATNAGQFYSNPVPVQLLKRDYVQDQSPTSECSPHLSSGPPPQLAHSYEPPMKRSSPPSSSSSYAPPSDESRLCHVCGEKAGKHSYYGGQVCPSCRAFFRRSVQSKYSDVYTCSKNKCCEITLKTRKNCQFCRFKLCEQAGMKRSWVLADGDRKKKPSTISASKASDAQPPCGSSAPDESRVPLSKSDSDMIQGYVDIMNRIKHQTENISPELMKEMAQSVMFKTTSLSSESRRSLKKVLEERTMLFANNLSEFVHLSKGDQNALLSGNTGTLIEFRLSTFFRTEFTWRKQVDMIMGQSDINKITDKLTGMKLEDNRLEYQQMFTSPWCQSEEFEKEHKNRLQKMSNFVEDDTIFCLISIIILFSVDEIESIQDHSYCEEQRLHFLFLLQKYLASKNNKSVARKKMTNAVNVISYGRELEQLSVNKCQGLLSECKM